MSCFLACDALLTDGDFYPGSKSIHYCDLFVTNNHTWLLGSKSPYPRAVLHADCHMQLPRTESEYCIICSR